MGDRAVLVTDVGDPAAWAAALRALQVPGVVDVVPGAETVLVTCAEPAALTAVRDAIERSAIRPDIVAGEGAAGSAPEVTIPVRYDGDDLDAVAAATGLTVDDVIARHSAAIYVAAFCGFSPGFAYLRGLPAELALPRRATPRTRVPHGSVAIAAEYTAIYPRTSPGGWHLLGTTDAELFDPARTQPALIQPGSRVRFTAARSPS